jgi:hypothetical protein
LLDASWFICEVFLSLSGNFFNVITPSPDLNEQKFVGALGWKNPLTSYHRDLISFGPHDQLFSLALILAVPAR